MSPDDIPALFVLTAAAAVLTVPRLWRTLSLTPLVGGKGSRLGMLGTLLGCVIALWSGLVLFAAREVRESFGYQLMFVAAGIIAIDVVSRGLALLGLDLETDGFERQNVAASIAIIGLWIAVTICAIGANIGEGAEIETTLFPLGLCAGGLLAVALGLSMATRGFSPIAIERDRAAGVRIGSLFVASSVPLARAAIGDWVSTEATVRDFAVAVPPLVALVVCAAVAEAWFTRARRNTPRGGSLWAHGVLPATGYFFLVTAAWRFIR